MLNTVGFFLPSIDSMSETSSSCLLLAFLSSSFLSSFGFFCLLPSVVFLVLHRCLNGIFIISRSNYILLNLTSQLSSRSFTFLIPDLIAVDVDPKSERPCESSVSTTAPDSDTSSEFATHLRKLRKS